MTEDTQVNVENLTPEQIADVEAAEKFILEFKDEDYEDPEKIEELKKAHKQAQTTIHQKVHFRDKAKKLEDALSANNIDPATGKPKVAAPATTTTTTTKKEEAPKGVDPLQVVTFRQDNPSLSKEVVAEIARIAGAFGISMEEAAGTETGKAVIKTLGNKESNADASLPPSRKSGTGLEKKDWSTASPAEIEAKRNQILTGQ